MPNFKHKIVIAGAGLSGLTAGLKLLQLGYSNITFVEATDGPGGRVKTEFIDGFTLNTGGHHFFTGYTAAEEFLDFDSLKLKNYDHGALIIRHNRLKKVVQPFNKSSFAYGLLLSDFGKFKDKINFIRKRIELGYMDEQKLFEKFEIKSSSLLKKKRFSTKIVNDFFKPVFSAFFKEEELTTSRRMLDFYLKLLSESRMCIPEKGIAEIPKQLASNFNESSFIYNQKVVGFEDHKVQLESGESIEADLLIVATEQIGLYNKFKKEPQKTNFRSTTCVYFSADSKPFSDALICVSAKNPKLVNNISVLTNISKAYAPKGKELICVTLNGFATIDDLQLVNEIKSELKSVFPGKIENWNLIKVYRHEYAIPNQDFVLGSKRYGELRLGKNLYACGDHMVYGNMNGAMKTGKLVAELIHRDLNSENHNEIKKRYSNVFGTPGNLNTEEENATQS